MPLPTKRKEAVESLADYTILICGEKNAGKTSFAAQFPNHFIFEFEPGNAKHLNCCYEDIPDLKTFDFFLKQAENAPEKRTIVIDEVQILYELCMEKLLKEAGVDDPQELGWAKGWKRIAAYFNRYITRLQALPGGNIYTAHCEYKEIKLTGGGTVDRIAPRIGKEVGRFRDKFTHICGMIMFSEGGNRDFYLQGNNLLEASCKLLDNHFRHEGRSIARFPMGSMAEAAYANFNSAFINMLEVPEEYYVPVEESSHFVKIQECQWCGKKHPGGPENCAKEIEAKPKSAFKFN